MDKPIGISDPKTTISASRTSLNLLHLSDNDPKLSWDVELMDDSTWSGSFTTDLGTTSCPSAVFYDSALKHISVTQATNGDIKIKRMTPADTADFTLTNFIQSSDSIIYSIYEGGVYSKDVMLVASSIATIADLKSGMIGEYDPSDLPLPAGIGQKATVWGLVIRAAVFVTVYLAGHVTDACRDNVRTARGNCNTPPCSFVAGFCSGACNCPTN